MIIQLQPDISPSQKESLIQKVNETGYQTTEVKTQLGSYLIGIGKKEFDIRKIGQMDGIVDIHIVSDEYKLVSRKWKAKPTSIDLGDNIFIKEGEMA
ncbi:MAG: 3-deoxy-7-phosphoheptulonate synthase, partial [Algoriphagus sp.]